MKAYSMRLALLTGISITTACSTALASHPNFEEPDVDVLYSMAGEQAGDSFGWVADPIGDIDSDGRPDFVTSAPFQVNDGVLTGKAYVFSGADGTLLHSLVGQPNEFMGYSATSAGDVNNDGVGDYILGTRVRAMVKSGADHSVIHEWIKPGEGFGYDSAAAGDLNHDGYDDVIIGAPFASGGAGRVYVFSGFDGSELWSAPGTGLSGMGVGPAGDIDDDGTPDVVVASPGAGKNRKGAALVLSGVDGSVLLELNPKTPSPSANGQSTFGRYHAHGAGDVNADGVPDIYVGDYNAKGGQHNANGRNSVGSGEGRAFVFSGLDGNILHEIKAENFGDGIGPGRGVPDINGDGHDDIFVAAWAYGQDDDNIDAGKGYLISGADGTVLRTMTGKTAWEYIGVDALSVGDVNADGKTDYMLTGWGTLHVILGN